MDPLTHTLFGAALATSPLGRWLEPAPPRPLVVGAGAAPAGAAPAGVPTAGPDADRPSRAVLLFLVVAANLPDVDAFLYLESRDLSLLCRRGWTHGVLAMVVWPLLLAAAWWLWVRRRTAPVPPVFGRPLAALSLALLSHPALDWLNAYGIRLLMPFSGRWFYGDALFIVDPWVWLGLGGLLCLASPRRWRFAVLWLVLGSLTSFAVLGATRALPASLPLLWGAGLLAIVLLRLAPLPPRWLAPRRLGLVAVGALVLYGATMAMVSWRGRALVAAAMAADGTSPTTVHDVFVGPRAATPAAWDVVVTTDGGYRVGRLDWRGPAERRVVLEPRLLALPDRTDPRVAAALAAPEVRGLVGWLRLPHVEVEADGDGWRVFILDLRFARDRRAPFGVVEVRLDAALRPTGVVHTT